MCLRRKSHTVDLYCLHLRRKIPHSRFILFASVLRFVATSTLTTNMVGGAGSESAAGAQAADVAAETVRAGMASGISDGSIPAEDEPKIEKEVGEKDDNEIKMKTLMDKIEALQKQVEALTKDKSSKDVSKNKMEVNGFDTRNAKRPGEWSGRKEDFLL